MKEILFTFASPMQARAAESWEDSIAENQGNGT
jgi:hypothetical protein